jgi:hypothetical protein
VHGNVGGGYPKDGLAYISLYWMVNKAKALGLNFLNTHLEEIENQADAHDNLYNSRAGLAGYYRYSPRPVTTLGYDTINGVMIDRPKVHKSAFERIRGGHVAYGPIGIPLVYDLVLRDGTIIPGPWDAVKGVDGEIKIVGTKPDGEAKSDYLEDGGRAQLRATRMEAIWNIVWWRRIVYFLTLFSSLYLVALPWLANALSTKQSLPDLTAWIAAYLEPILTVAQYLVPDWVGKTWLSKFGEEPVLFLIGLVCVAVTMLIGSSLEETIRSRAGETWHASWRTVPKWAVDPKSTWLYKLRSNANVIKVYRYFAWRVLPTIVLLICTGIVAWLWWRYPSYVTIYVILVLFAIVVRSWVFRGQYTAKKMSRSADAHH